MSLIRGLFVRKDATRGTTPVEARKALAGLFLPVGTFGARAGVLSGGTVAGTTSWNYVVAACHLVLSRAVSDGAVLTANDGAALVPTLAAPGTGGRIDLVWVRHNDVDAGDTTSDVVFGVTSGTVSGTPVAPALPAGALELARATVMAGATNTAHASVTITNTAQRTGLRGGIVDVPDAAARVALGNPPAGTSFYATDTSTGVLWKNAGALWEPVTAGAWTPFTPQLQATTTPPTLGTGGTATGRFQRVGQTVTGWAQFSFGSTNVNPGSGAYIIAGLPFPIAHPAVLSLEAVRLFDSSAFAYLAATADAFAASSAVLRYSGGNVSNTTPWTWAAGDQIIAKFTYETSA